MIDTKGIMISHTETYYLISLLTEVILYRIIILSYPTQKVSFQKL